MPRSDIETRQFTGAPLSIDFLSANPTFLLTGLNAPLIGTLADNEGILATSDTGISLYQGDTLEYVGSGTFTPGVEVLGTPVPIGDPVDVVIFNANGSTYFHFPDQQPNLIGSLIAILDIDTTPYQIFENPYLGTPGDDVFIGDEFDNIMNGELGNDSIDAQAGADIINTDAGDDTVSGGDGADTIDGGDGIDLIKYLDSTAAVTVNLDTGTGSGGAATGDVLTGFEDLSGSIHDDTLIGSDVTNDLRGNDGNDTMYGAGGDDFLFGGAGDDMMDGGDADDVLFAKDGDDLVLGGAGNDKLRGDDGNDTLDGGTGNDILRGNAGADTFIFSAGGDKDLIVEFEDNIDTLHLDQSIWGGNMTLTEVFDTYATQNAERVVLDFANGDKLLIGEVTDYTTILDDIVLV